MKLLDGKKTAQAIIDELKIRPKGSRPPGLAVLLIGENPASKIYVSAKKKKCAEVGIATYDHQLPALITEKELLSLIHILNNDPLIDGILLQQPLPEHIDKQNVVLAIDPQKDVDGFHPLNIGHLLLGNLSSFIPCTPYGIAELVRRNGLSFYGKEVVIVGRSPIVGKPLAALLMQNTPEFNATVTVVHSKSPHIDILCQRADILVAAIGQPHFIKASMVKEGAIVVDVGINRDAQGNIIGDVDFINVAPKASHITPVPGGIGPMTIAMLLSNTYLSYQHHHGDRR